MFREQFFKMQSQRVRGRRSYLRHTLHVVRVRPREAGARHDGVRVRVRQHDRLVALDLWGDVGICSKGTDGEDQCEFVGLDISF